MFSMMPASFASQAASIQNSTGNQCTGVWMKYIGILGTCSTSRDRRAALTKALRVHRQKVGKNFVAMAAASPACAGPSPAARSSASPRESVEPPASARTAWPPSVATARPSRASLVPPPYPSAESKKVTPAATHWATMASTVASCILPPFTIFSSTHVVPHCNVPIPNGCCNLIVPMRKPSDPALAMAPPRSCSRAVPTMGQERKRGEADPR
mmetsp:Transcript_36129/g.104065  ORF Transcript_36129/g.104065 Transcript_36129/m.104065 type:complete len:212 (+) Transcript_36129:737-1372(+)